MWLLISLELIGELYYCQLLVYTYQPQGSQSNCSPISAPIRYNTGYYSATHHMYLICIILQDKSNYIYNMQGIYRVALMTWNL